MDEFNTRDLFAGLAMVGLLAKDGYWTGIPQNAYDIADAMLLEKEKRDADQSIGS